MRTSFSEDAADGPAHLERYDVSFLDGLKVGAIERTVRRNTTSRLPARTDRTYVVFYTRCSEAVAQSGCDGGPTAPRADGVDSSGKRPTRRLLFFVFFFVRRAGPFRGGLHRLGANGRQLRNGQRGL